MDQKFLKKAIEVVEKHISNNEFSVELFGQEMAMSRVQLHRKLTALVEQSASEFIRTIRLNKAAIQLKEKSGNIAEIAYGVGFSNPSYFSECFRKQFGKFLRNILAKLQYVTFVASFVTSLVGDLVLRMVLLPNQF